MAHMGNMHNCMNVVYVRTRLHTPMHTPHNLAHHTTPPTPKQQGPTLTMKIHAYSLMRDVIAAQQRPQVPPTLWHTAPLLVMNNFRGSKPLQLATALLQHLFPSIDVNTVKLANCQV